MKQVIKKIMFFIFPLVFLLGCDETSNINDNDSIHGSGRIVSQIRTVDECNSLTIHTVGDVYLTQDTIQSIRIEADDNIMDYVITRKENETLVVGLEDGSYSDITLKIYISLKAIKKLSINGAGNINSENSFNSDSLDITINGAGNINVHGEGNYLDCLINGAGNIIAENFIVEKCKVLVNGTGTCTVNVTEDLNAAINGAGTIFYFGNPPIIKTSITGLGQIIKK